MTPPNISHMPIQNATLRDLETEIRALIDKMIEECETNSRQHVSVAELLGLFTILSMDYYHSDAGRAFSGFRR